MIWIVKTDDSNVYLSNGKSIPIPVNIDKNEFVDIIKSIMEAGN